MSYRSLPLTSKMFQFSALSLALALAGCGGGDGGTDVIAPEPDTGITQPGTDTGGGTGGTPTAPVSEINITPISLVDANGNITRTITSAGASAQVRVTDELGDPIASALVMFSGEGVAFGTTNGAVLTNEQGEATISVRPLQGTDTGSYQLTATASADGDSTTSPGYSFSLQSINVALTDIRASSSNLNSGGNTNITLKTRDMVNNVNQNDITVTFDASCGTFDNDSVVSNNQGDVTATYIAIDDNDNLCEGTQTITVAPANNPSNRQTITVNIASVEANSVVYTTTQETRLGASNSGSSNSGQITFTIFADGRPAANQQVVISKVFAPGDFSFITSNNQTARTVTSDSQGQVVVNLYPGALPGPVEIKAALASNPNVFALSKNVSVATGRATQNGFSVSLSKNVLAIGTDGDTATITARLVDRVGNPVPNGTVVSFVSEGGRVTPNCATQNGACSVEFSTQNPRPTDSRVSVVAYLEGDKDYIDRDGDNQFSAGDVLTRNIGDFFRDDNENNRYDANLGEFIYRRNASGATCAVSTFNQPNTGNCDSGLQAILRYQFVLGLASDSPVYQGLPSSSELPANAKANPDIELGQRFRIYGNSALTVSMPSGTTVSVAADDRTNYSPVAELVGNQIQVSNAEPNSTSVVRAGSSSINVRIGPNGTGVASSGGLPAGTALTVTDRSSSCEVELTSGSTTVPSIVNLGAGRAFDNTSFGKVLDSEVSYGLAYTGCRPNDVLHVIVTSPNGVESSRRLNIV